MKYLFWLAILIVVGAAYFFQAPPVVWIALVILAISVLISHLVANDARKEYRDYKKQKVKNRSAHQAARDYLLLAGARYGNNYTLEVELYDPPGFPAAKPGKETYRVSMIPHNHLYMMNVYTVSPFEVETVFGIPFAENLECYLEGKTRGTFQSVPHTQEQLAIASDNAPLWDPATALGVVDSEQSHAGLDEVFKEDESEPNVDDLKW